MRKGVDVKGDRSNFYGVNYIMWFDIGIEGKDSMNPDEEDWGGKIEFGYQDKNFSIEVEDYFLMFEYRCSLDPVMPLWSFF